MRPQDQKAILTKAIRSYLHTSTVVAKKKVKIEGHPLYEVIFTPNSNMLLTYTVDHSPPFMDRISIPRFSDWVVEAGAYQSFITSAFPIAKKEKQT